MTLVDSYREQTDTPNPAIIEVLYKADSAIKHGSDISIDLNGGKDGRSGRGASVDLFNRRLRDEDVLHVTNALRAVGVKALRSLDMSANCIGNEGAEYIATFLSSVRVDILTLRLNDIGPLGAKALAGALRGEHAPMVLNLSGNKIGKEGGLYIAKALRKNATLTSLDLSDTDINVDVIIELADHLQTCRTLSALDISSPLRCRRESDVIFQHVGKMLRVNESIESLSLRNVGMGDNEVKILVSYLMENHTLRNLDLSKNRIGFIGARTLTDLFEKDTQRGGITHLNLSCNRIQDKGAVAFAQILSENASLSTLHLDRCGITDAGLNALAKSLAKNARLRRLFLWGNMFESRSACRFMDVLDNERSHLELDVRPYVVDGTWGAAKLTLPSE